MNQRQSIQRITRLGILIAIIVLMTFVPNIGYIQTGLLSITTIHIPVIVGSALLGPIGGLVLGTTWGITSFLKVLSMPSTIETAIFLNPMVSIFPRILVGLIISYTTMGLSKLVKNKDLKYALVAGIGTLSNTVLVFSSIF
ncbi:MAG: ECF transporter S component, partial [Erysipelotrichaceae bacterium]|nr:ECF transporter S component [Erysipelotrichaceae bacterium]